MEIAATSTEYLHVGISISIAGNPIASAQPPSLAILAASRTDNPTVEDWLTGEWAGQQARILVGPNGGATTLTPGRYKVWVQFTAGAESPVIRSGLITVY